MDEDDDQAAGEPDEDDGQEGEPDEEENGRRVRSTPRRDDVPDLPRLPVEKRTVGRVFEGSDGKRWRPSMFVTFTMDSYGPVRPDGAPVNPATYDYRRAALDALHLSKLWDRLIQNLRRAVGYEVQYFAVLEPQRRLAPHIHAAIRGAIPRRLLRQVIAATYASVWWPPHEQIVYADDHIPVWDSGAGGYVDPDNAMSLPTWDQALDELDADEDAHPAHVVRFSRQSDMQGLIGGTAQADRRIGYLTKYLTKAITDPLDDEDEASAARETHIDRMHAELRWLPCSPRCANWLAYGIQPKDATDGMAPGECPLKAHDREHLGCGGRRVLVSRNGPARP
ncbi:replication initiator [Actinopolymorpha sp. B17G11]|uniref:replication initiator n=1 Tax=Actinopolymorpha sp. B17G11 TaxID=3160861 RepID=UPI0032E41615